MKIRIPLFKILVLFAVTFFVYNDFNIRMMFGYGILVVSMLGFILFSENRISITREKRIYLLLAFALSFLSIIRNKDESIIFFVLAIDLCACVAVIGEIRINEFISTIKLLMIVSFLMSLYVIIVKIDYSVYTLVFRRMISEQSQIVNMQLLRDGYGISLGGNVVFIDYVLTLGGLLCFNVIMVYKNKLRYRWVYWGCFISCFIGMLFENRKSEILAFLIGVFLCFRVHMSISNIKEKAKARLTTLFIVIISIFFCVYLSSLGFLDRYLIFFERLLGNTHSSGSKVDVTSGRTVLWILALKLFSENPVFGIGWGNFRNYVPSYYNNLQNAHNNYIQILCETGVLGFMLTVIPMIILFVYTVKNKRNFMMKNVGGEPLSMVASISSYGLQISFFALSFLDPCWYKMSFWPFFAIAIMMANGPFYFERERRGLSIYH